MTTSAYPHIIGARKGDGRQRSCPLMPSAGPESNWSIRTAHERVLFLNAADTVLPTGRELRRPLADYSPESQRRLKGHPSNWVIRMARGAELSLFSAPRTPCSLTIGDRNGRWRSSHPMPSAANNQTHSTMRY